MSSINRWSGFIFFLNKFNLIRVQFCSHALPVSVSNHVATRFSKFESYLRKISRAVKMDFFQGSTPQKCPFCLDYQTTENSQNSQTPESKSIVTSTATEARSTLAPIRSRPYGSDMFTFMEKTLPFIPGEL